MITECLYHDGLSEVWWADALDAGAVDHIVHGWKLGAMIVDAPYSEKTHSGHSSGRLSPAQLARYAARDTSGAPSRERRYAARKGASSEHRRDLSYAAWSPNDVESFVDLWAPLVSGWCVSLTDNVLAPHWAGAFDGNGLLAFSPLAFVELGSRVRMTGDGPAQWSCWCVVARPRTKLFAKWGALPGAYVVPGERAFNSDSGSDRVVGGKPLVGMERLVRDYSRAGDTVVDPCCGAGTTLVAAKRLGRYAIGVDRDRAHCEIAARRLRETRFQPGLYEERTKRAAVEQAQLFKA